MSRKNSPFSSVDLLHSLPFRIQPNNLNSRPKSKEYVQTVSITLMGIRFHNFIIKNLKFKIFNSREGCVPLGKLTNNVIRLDHLDLS